ncbi:hypothetical protein BIV57_01195 [Mangrovactinospora gilvigrisea]|uniref:DUF7507 domain-containing protein n=1 Tax=Mangrovactinospora gilvigrisea TaxID=1428644 RepID=A0A1J7BLF3_9ACTN|nr:hypothetical protein [Mangrovactinospora gilvigrisea]OIV39478.1 hypothetical protein BIV57_01195 [Mangrovactinospora gilvigrisea]
MTGLALISANALLATASPQAHAAGGSVILSETFTGSKVPDRGVHPLADACLTGAITPPPPSASTIGPCTHTTSAPLPGTPGYLQLTDAEQQRNGSMIYNRPLPGNGGLRVEFEQYQYGGNGADGIGFFLADGSRNVTAPGAKGGSLGYAQSNYGGVNENGVPGGYLGVGLDAWGNYATDGNGRGTGCATKSPHTAPTRFPNAVTLRGAGDGFDGYCVLASTIGADGRSTLPGSLRADTLADAKRTVVIEVSAEARPTVTVSIDFHDGNGSQQVLKYTMPKDAPKTYKFGFSGSTGGVRDTHLIRNLKVSSVKPLDALNLVKQVDQSKHKQPAKYRLGDVVPYQFVVTNTTTRTLTQVKVHDPKIKHVRCEDTTLTPAGTAGSSTTCTGTYKITDRDALRGLSTNTARAAGKNPDGDNVPSNPSTVTVPVVKMPPKPHHPKPKPKPIKAPNTGRSLQPATGPQPQ